MSVVLCYAKNIMMNDVLKNEEGVIADSFRAKCMIKRGWPFNFSSLKRLPNICVTVFFDRRRIFVPVIGRDWLIPSFIISSLLYIHSFTPSYSIRVSMFKCQKLITKSYQRFDSIRFRILFFVDAANCSHNNAGQKRKAH